MLNMLEKYTKSEMRVRVGCEILHQLDTVSLVYHRFVLAQTIFIKTPSIEADNVIYR